MLFTSPSFSPAIIISCDGNGQFHFTFSNYLYLHVYGKLVSAFIGLSSKISQFWNVGSLYKRCPLFNKDPSTLTFIKKSGEGRETVQILSDIHHISEVDIRNALHSPIGPLVGVKTNWDYRQLMGLKGPAFVNVFAWPEIHWP